MTSLLTSEKGKFCHVFLASHPREKDKQPLWTHNKLEQTKANAITSDALCTIQLTHLQTITLEPLLAA